MSMSPRMKVESDKPSPQSQTMDQINVSFVPSASDSSSISFQDDELSNRDSFSLHSSDHTVDEASNALNHYWTLNDPEALNGELVPCSEEQSHGVQMPFPVSQHLLPSALNQNDLPFHNVSDSSAVRNVAAHNDLELSQAHQDFQTCSLLEDLVYDNDACSQNGLQNYHDDFLSLGHDALTDDKHLAGANDAWSSLQASALGQISPDFLPPVPVSPPLTEASNDISVTSSCSNTGYTLPVHDDVLFAEVATPIGGQGINLRDPLFPVTPPLTAHDPNRTIRPSKQKQQRPSLSTTTSQSKYDNDGVKLQSLPARETSRQQYKDNAETRNPREHPYYSLPIRNDGKYHCPFATGDKPCSHTPTTQKCAYHKYLDSHLKPYRCKVPACSNAQLQFSSNACLFRHEREAHGLHGHGDNPHLCLFDNCERSIPGNGFPRRWNLYDHMRRVHEYGSDQSISPEVSPMSGQVSKKGENSGRKRKASGVAGTYTMKQTRSNSSQKNHRKTSCSSGRNEQKLLNAERDYYGCRARLLDELSHITPQDSAMHEKVNASLQELITLGLNYRHVEAGQVASK